MIINIFGPSGSGKTSFIREILRTDSSRILFEKFNTENFQENFMNKISVSLIPIPLFRGSLREFFNIFSLEIENLLNLDEDLRDLLQTIFRNINKNTINKIALRRIETLSAGEVRRLFLLKSLLVDSDIMVIDEPFSNSDEKLWGIIYKAINIKKRSIILSHLPLENLFGNKENIISIDIKDIKLKFNK